jgi:aspartate/methionine/tyrosine aminotransferase
MLSAARNQPHVCFRPALSDAPGDSAEVATVAGTSFGIHGEGYIRFSHANSVENIGEAIRRIAALLRD